MIVFELRIFIFTILPLLLAGSIMLLDLTAKTKERKLEIFLILIFALGVAGGGIGNFFAHFFLSDMVAQSIGWPTGSPFQLEIAFANLALGILGIVAVGRRDGFREATVIAVTVFAFGATIVHIMDIVKSGNLAPGNSLQNIQNIFKPALLIAVLMMARREEVSPRSETINPAFESWRMPVVQAASIITAVVATAFGIGFTIDQPVLVTLLGTVLGFGVLI